MNPIIPVQPGISELSIIPIALVLGAVIFIGLSVIAGLLIIVVVANRAEPDSSGRRPLAVYFFGMSFIAVFLTLFGTYAIVLGLVQLIGSHEQTGFQSSMHPVGDAVTRVVVISGLIVLVGAVLLVTHLRRGLALPEWRHGAYGPVGRVAQSYAAAVCFVSVLIAALAFIALGYELCRLVAPGVFEYSGPQVGTTRTVVSLVYLVGAAIAIVVVHSRIPPNGFWGTLWSAHTGSGPDRSAAAVSGPAPAPPQAQQPQAQQPQTPRIPPPPPQARSQPESAPPRSPPLPSV